MLIKKLLYLFIFFSMFSGTVYAQTKPANRTVQEFDGQGRLKSILKYQHNELVRKRVYHEKGQLLFDTIYRGEKPIVIKTYYLNGQLKSVWSQKSGVARFFYPTGQQKIIIPVTNPDRLKQ